MGDLEIVEDILNREGWNGPTFLDAGDRGLRTAWGISERAHPDAWQHGPPSKDQARAIYLQRYVEPWAWVPDDKVRAFLVDWMVTSGGRPVVKALQATVGAKVDGILGPETKRLTLAAVNAGRPVLPDLIRARAEHYMAIALDEPRLRVLMNTAQPLQIRYLRGWLRRTLSFLTVWLLCVLPASAQSTPQEKVYQWSLVAAAATHTADIAVTGHCIGKGTCREANPTLRWANDKPTALGLAKGALAGSLHLAIHRLLWKRGYKWQAIAANAVVISVTAGVTARNARY